MQANQDPLTRLVLKHEGGYTNEAADPGGPTKYGITIWDARKYWKPSATAEDVRAMPLGIAISIYDKHYWDPIRGDELPSGVDYVVYDYGINSGVARPPKVLHRILGVDETGMGQRTVDLVRGSDPHKIIDAVCDERIHFLQTLKNWPTYRNGWSTRVREVRSVAHSLVGNVGLPPVAPQVSEISVPKGTHVDPKLPGNVAVGAGSGGTIFGGITQYLSGDVLTTIALTGGVVLVMGLAGYAAYRSQHRRQDLVALPTDSVAIKSLQR